MGECITKEFSIMRSTWINEKSKLEEMLASGMTLDKIGEQYGVKKQRISQVLTKIGVKTRYARKNTFLRDKPSKYYWLDRMLKSKRVDKEERLFLLENTDLPEKCPMLGIDLNYDGCDMSQEGFKGRRDDSPSIDRIDSQLGYKIGNIQVISWRANRIKNDATIEELELISNYMKKYLV